MAVKIGGIDMVFDGAGSPGEGRRILDVLQRRWPDAVVQGADYSGFVAASDPSIDTMREFFVYRSHADFESWNSNGASEVNADAMVNVMLGPTSTTIVVDRWGSSLYSLLAAGEFR